MRRSTAKLIRKTARATGANYRALKQAFYNLGQKDRHLARLEMKDAFKRKPEPEWTEEQQKEWEKFRNETQES